MSGESCWSCHGSLSSPPKPGCRNKKPHVCGKRHGRGIERCTLTIGVCQSLDADDRAKRLELRPSEMVLAANDLFAAVEWWHRPRDQKEKQWGRRWLVVREFVFGGRRIDALAIDTWGELERPRNLIAYEMKSARSDWLAELNNPEKRDAALELATQFNFISAPGVIEPNEVPEPCGLLHVTAGNKRRPWIVDVVVPAHELGHATDPATGWLVAIRLARMLRDSRK